MNVFLFSLYSVSNLSSGLNIQILSMNYCEIMKINLIYKSIDYILNLRFWNPIM